MNRPNSQTFLSLKGAGVCEYESCERQPAIDIATVYTQYHRRVFLWCFRIVRNTEDAQDLTQEAFMQIMRKLHTFRGEAAISTWLYRVVLNTALMWLRRKRLPYSSLDEILDVNEGAIIPNAGVKAVDQIVGALIARVDLPRALKQMPPGFRAAVLLHDGEDYTHSEIAEFMGWTIGTSKSQLHKARRRMRQLLGCDQGEESPSAGRGKVRPVKSAGGDSQPSPSVLRSTP